MHVLRVSEAVQKNQMLPRVVPFAIYILFLVVGDLLAPLFGHLEVSSKWLYLFRIVVVLAALIYFMRNYIELIKRPPLQDFLYATVAGLIVFIVWIAPYPDWLVVGGNAVGINPILGLSNIEAMLWISSRVMGAALIVPIMEELFWRSYIMRRYDSQNFLSVNPETISTLAFIGSACLFALEHKLLLAGLFAGLVYGQLYKTYKNLWLPIFSHAVTNGVLGIWVVTTGNWQYW